MPAAITRRRMLVAAAAGSAALLRPLDAVAGEDLDAFVRRQMAEARVPGAAAAILRDGRVVRTFGWGWADVTRRRLVTPSTSFMLASVSKTAIAIAAMQAVEDGVLDLDADVNEVLPFAVRNPGHPDTPITMRMLLTHTSSIHDAWAAITPFYVPGDSRIALGTYLRRYLTPAGDLFRPRHTFDAWAPGDRYRYCNVGADLAGYVIERANGTGFDDRCDARIFRPLGMRRRTGWHLADVPRERVAMPYSFRDGGFITAGHYGYPDYPSGQLRSSAEELARMFLAFIGMGALDGTRILSADSVREIGRPQIPALEEGQGLIWYRERRRGRVLLGHDGGDRGVATHCFFRPDDGVGVLLLANGDWRWNGHRYPLMAIFDRLFAEADRPRA
jgi:CubicO group peptidase (beta-lactamase class C family)